MDCILCKIAKHEIPAAIVYEDSDVIALMCAEPLRPGHVLVNSREHFPYFDDVPNEVASKIFHVGQLLARALKALYGVSRVAFAFTGGDIPHTHGHLVPMHEKTDITSRLYIAEEQLTFRDVPQMPLEERMAIANKIRSLIADA